MPVELLEKRRRDAEASGGASSSKIYNLLLQRIAHANLCGSVLELGAGHGILTGQLASLGRFSHVCAADIMGRPAALPPSVHWIKADLNEPLLDIGGSTFDVVIMSELIEHLENPRALLREAYRVLRPGGTLLLTTPNNESWRSVGSLLLRGHFAAFTGRCYPAHKTALLRLDIQRAAAEAGFSNMLFGFTNHGGLPFRPSVTWQEISLGFLRGLRFSDNLLFVATKVEAHSEPPSYSPIESPEPEFAV